MQKPNNYDNTTATGEFTPIELGGHTAVIKRVQESTNSSGKPMIIVAIDFDKQDIQPEYFAKQFAADTREDKKWPYQGMQWITTEDSEGNCTRSFKSFISSVEKSNNAECAWGDGFEKWFVGKKIGAVYGENEEEYNGEVKTRRKLRYFCQYDRAKDASVPEKRFLKEPAKPAVNISSVNDFMNIPDGADDEIPY